MNRSDSSDPAGQAADLRTRIAAVLFRLRGFQGWDNETDECREMWRRDADAVIRELNDMGIIHLSRVVGCQTGPVGHEGECR